MRLALTDLYRARWSDQIHGAPRRHHLKEAVARAVVERHVEHLRMLRTQRRSLLGAAGSGMPQPLAHFGPAAGQGGLITMTAPVDREMPARRAVTEMRSIETG